MNLSRCTKLATRRLQFGTYAGSWRVCDEHHALLLTMEREPGMRVSDTDFTKSPYAPKQCDWDALKHRELLLQPRKPNGVTKLNNTNGVNHHVRDGEAPCGRDVGGGPRTKANRPSPEPQLQPAPPVAGKVEGGGSHTLVVRDSSQREGFVLATTPRPRVTAAEARANAVAWLAKQAKKTVHTLEPTRPSLSPRVDRPAEGKSVRVRSDEAAEVHVVSDLLAVDASNEEALTGAAAVGAAVVTPLIQKFYLAIRNLEGRSVHDIAWNQVILVLGLAWQRYELTDDDVAALEAFLRTLRFPKR